MIARVAGKPIAFSAVQQLIAAESPKGRPVPPDYEKCILAAKQSEAGAQKSEAQLKQGCQQRYEELLKDAVSKAIHAQWLLGEGEELGLRVSPAEIQQEYEQDAKAFKRPGEFAAYLKHSGQSVASVKRELKLGKLADQIFALIKGKEHPPSSAEVAAYYSSHIKEFTTPAGREVRIFRTTIEASAKRAISEIKAGKSFAQVAMQLSAIGQPIGAKEGLVKDLLPNEYEEKTLNDPIFSAQLHKLYGPLQITAAHKTIAPETNTGFFVYEVIGLIPAKQAPLSAVKASIAKALSEARKASTLATFITAFRRKWTARSDCEAGFIAPNCKQYKGADVGAGDPYTL